MPALEPLVPHHPLRGHAPLRINAERDDVVGEVQITLVVQEDTLSDIARRSTWVGKIVRANPASIRDPASGQRGRGAHQFVLPLAGAQGRGCEHRGHAHLLLPADEAGESRCVYTHPIGIGKVAGPRPKATRIVSKQKNPEWRPTASFVPSTRRTARSCRRGAGRS